MNKTYFVILSTCVCVSVIYQLVYLNFMDTIYKRKPSADKAIIFIIPVNVYIVVYELLGHFPFIETYVVKVILIFFTMKCIYKVNFQVAFYLSIISQFYVNGMMYLLMAIGGWVTVLTVPEIMSNATVFAGFFLASRFIILIIFSIVRVTLLVPNRGRKLLYNGKQLAQVIVTQLLACVLMMLIISTYPLYFSPKNYAIVLFGILFSSYLYLKIFYLNALDIHELHKTQNYTQELERQVLYQMRHYRTFKEEVAHLKKLSHDYHSLMSVLEKLMRQSPKRETQEFVEGFIEEVRRVKPLNNKFSNNIVVDALLTETATLCEANAIRLEAQVYLDEKIQISSFVIVRIVSNLLRNAMDACEKVLPKERFICVKTTSKDDWTVFTVANSYDGHTEEKHGKLISTKLNSQLHGYGLSIVAELVEEIGGVLVVDPNEKEKIFTVKILFSKCQ